MTTCLCGATGFYNRRELAQHIVDKHGANAPRALTLAQRIIDKLKLAPEDYAVFGTEPPAQTAAPSRAQREASEERSAGLADLPSPEAVIRATAAITGVAATVDVCIRCKERPKKPGKQWCTECADEARAHARKPRRPRQETRSFPSVNPESTEPPAPGEWGNGSRKKNVRAVQPELASPITCPRCPNEYLRRFDLINHLVMLHGLNATDAMNLAQDTEKQQERARVAQPIERRTTSAEVAGSSPAPRSTPPPAAELDGPSSSSYPPAPEETPMADLSKPIACKECRKPFTRTHHLQKTCAACRGDKCTNCHRAGGQHAASCPKVSGAAKRAPKKATGGGKKKAKARVARRAQRPTRETPRPVAETPVAAILDGNGTRKKAEALLVDLRDLRMKLDVKISHVEELVTIL